MKTAIALLAFGLLTSGCFHDVGPVVTDVSQAPGGALHVQRCELYSGWGGSYTKDCHDTAAPTSTAQR